MVSIDDFAITSNENIFLNFSCCRHCLFRVLGPISYTKTHVYCLLRLWMEICQRSNIPSCKISNSFNITRYISISVKKKSTNNYNLKFNLIIILLDQRKVVLRHWLFLLLLFDSKPNLVQLVIGKVQVSWDRKLECLPFDLFSLVN